MNIILDAWLPIRRRHGERETVCFSQLVEEDIIDFDFVREDFQGAAYQLAIAVLQTLYAPEDEFLWQQRYQWAPTQQELDAVLQTGRHAFELVAEGENQPRFMQDFHSLDAAKPSPISGLLIDAPGGNTLKHNTDHFVKRDLYQRISLPMAAIALFTLQTNAPSGGQGHRTGLRGGGPLTTLVLPNDPHASLWQKLWLNVLSREVFSYDDPDLHSGAVFPWLEATKESQNPGTEIFAKDVHPLHMYWAMPRRIRLEVEQVEAVCDLTALSCDQSVRYYRTQNYGHNYSGSWWHPLTHYRSNPKKPEDDNLSTKGQPGGVTYKYWHALTFLDQQDGNHPAQVVNTYINRRSGRRTSYPMIWAFGYDLDNMKCRGWYSTTLPLLSVEARHRDRFLHESKMLQQIAIEALKQCRTQIKSAWFVKASEVKGDISFIDAQFYQRTERAFYQMLACLTTNGGELPTDDARRWLSVLQRTVMDLFDEHVALNNADSSIPKEIARIIAFRQKLTQWWGGKYIKDYKYRYQIAETSSKSKERSR